MISLIDRVYQISYSIQRTTDSSAISSFIYMLFILKEWQFLFSGTLYTNLRILSLFLLYFSLQHLSSSDRLCISCLFIYCLPLPLRMWAPWGQDCVYFVHCYVLSIYNSGWDFRNSRYRFVRSVVNTQLNVSNRSTIKTQSKASTL